MESMELLDCSICSRQSIGCNDCSTPHQLGIVPAIIGAVASIGSTIYQVQAQKKASEQARKQAEEDLRALQEAEKQKIEMQIKAQQQLALIEARKPKGLKALGINPEDLLIIAITLGGFLVVMTMFRR